MNHCLVVGGGGFIGRPLVELLKKSGRKVSVLEIAQPRQPVSARQLASRVDYIIADYGDEKALKKILRGIDEIVLLAYSSVPKTSFDDPLSDINQNLPRALSHFKVASTFPLKKLVIVSSGGAVYGDAIQLPIDETHPTNPISPYGITKLAIEKYALMFWRMHNLPVVILRPGNAYGEGQRPYTGQGFVSTAIASILSGKTIEIYEENGGKQGRVRDYIYVTDIAEGILSALDSGTLGAVYNVGTGVGTTNRQVLEALEDLAKTARKEIKVKMLPARSFDVTANVLDSTKLKHDTKWQAHIGLEEGLSKTWEWFRNLK